MGLWEDVRFAARLLLKDQWFTLVAAIALALGIGVNATVFTFVNAVLIRGLPIADPDRTLAVDSYDRAHSRGTGVSYLDYRDWKDNTRTFEAFGAAPSLTSATKASFPSASTGRTFPPTGSPSSAPPRCWDATSWRRTIGAALPR